MKSVAAKILVKPDEDQGTVTVSGVELKIDTSFAPNWYAPHRCRVVGDTDKKFGLFLESRDRKPTLIKYPIDVQEGDIVYVDHKVCANDAHRIPLTQDTFVCDWELVYAIRRGEEIIPVRDIVFMEPIEKPREENGWVTSVSKEVYRDRARCVWFNDYPETQGINLEKGKIYAIARGADYLMKIEGNYYYAMKHDDILAVIHETA